MLYTRLSLPGGVCNTFDTVSSVKKRKLLNASASTELSILLSISSFATRASFQQGYLCVT